MKNEYKIDRVSMHEDRGMVKQKFKNIIGALERGLMAARAAPVQIASFGCLIFLLLLGSFGSTFGTSFRLHPVYFSL